eukprot:Sdes_comp20369_c0_seq2m14192
MIQIFYNSSSIKTFSQVQRSMLRTIHSKNIAPYAKVKNKQYGKAARITQRGNAHHSIPKFYTSRHGHSKQHSSEWFSLLYQHNLYLPQDQSSIEPLLHFLFDGMFAEKK